MPAFSQSTAFKLYLVLQEPHIPLLWKHFLMSNSPIPTAQKKKEKKKDIVKYALHNNALLIKGHILLADVQ